MDENPFERVVQHAAVTVASVEISDDHLSARTEDVVGIVKQVDYEIITKIVDETETENQVLFTYFAAPSQLIQLEQVTLHELDLSAVLRSADLRIDGSQSTRICIHERRRNGVGIDA
jgi:phosphoenolpyruvate-protein kinase (PTS system EI component)